MKPIIRTLLLMSAFYGIATGWLSAAEPPTDVEIKTIIRQRVDTDKKCTGIVVGIVDEKGPRIISYGRTAREGGSEVNGDTIFELGSITKVFTATVLADMVQHDEVTLDDPIAKYLPTSVKVPTRNGAEIKLVDLATQSSGLPRLPDNLTPADGENPYADYTVQQMYDFLSGYKLKRDIGKKYEYSNFGMGLLGHVLALKAGTDYEAMVQKRVCRPLGLTSTQIKLTPELRARMAQGYNEAGLAVANWDIPTLAGCGALRSSANDLLKFASANLGLTKSELASAMTLAQTPRRPAGGMKIGLAWHIANKYGTELVWHNGGTGGYRTFLGLDQKHRRAIVVLANSANEVDDIGFHLLESRYDLQESDTPAPVASVADAKALDACAGRYQFNASTFFDVRRAGDHLQGKMTGQDWLDIYAESPTEFYNKQVEAKISFHPTNLVLHQGGIDQTAKKISAVVPGEKKQTAIPFEPAMFDAYAGEYQIRPGAILTLKRVENRYFVKLTGQTFLEIFPKTDRVFFLKVVEAQLIFVKDAQGTVKGVILRQNGVDQNARKIK